MRFVFLSLFFGLFSGAAFACVIPPKQASLEKKELIEHTKTIVLAELIGAIEGKELTAFSFNVVETLKGTKSGEFSLQLMQLPKAIRSAYADSDSDFDSHRDASFFASKYGRLPWLPGMCSPNYEFSKGKKYLLFLESLENGASAEMISSPNDGWYQYVRENLRETRHNSLQGQPL